MGRDHAGVGLAAGLAATGFVASGIVGGTYPFGSISRNGSDLGVQYLPLHAHLWDLLHGTARGDLIFNWQSGFGVPFLPDFAFYLSSPFALLVGLFPRDQIDLAVYVITVLKLMAAAAAMAVYLTRLRPGSPWLVGVFGAAYGLCGWAIDDSSYVPMWLDGLIAFPLFCLVGEWSLRGRRPLLSIAVVAVFWYSNFYTAYMATIGAGVVFAVRLVTSDVPRLRVVARYALSVGIGVALTAPLLLPGIKANGIGPVAPPVDPFNPVAAHEFLSRLLPMAQGVGVGPRIFVGTAVLLLALTLPLNKSVPAFTRIAWAAAAVLLAISFQWGPTHQVWHGFDAPNGNPYRQAFVLCGVLVIAGWLSVAHRPPGLPAVGGALVALAGLGLFTQDSRWLNQHSVRLFALSVAVCGLAALALRWVKTVAVLLFVGVVLVEGSLTAVAIHQDRAKYYKPVPVWRDDQATALRDADGWPDYRADPGSATGPNDVLMFGGQGGGYFSSMMPGPVFRTLADLGFAWSGNGRSIGRLDSPVTDALFSVGVTVHDGTVERTPVPPLVTVRPALITGRADTVFGRHEALLGSRLYEVPPYRIGPIRRTPGLAAPIPKQLTARCRPHSIAYLYAPTAVGSVQLRGAAPAGLLWRKPRNPQAGQARLVELGQVPPSGEVSVTLRLAGGAFPRTGALGCLDPTRLRAAVNRLRASGAVEVRADGHKISATLPRPTSGVAMVATPWVPGWRCATDDGEWREPVSSGGLLAVPLAEPTTRISCRYRPPGLVPGLIIAGLAILGMALTAVLRRS